MDQLKFAFVNYLLAIAFLVSSLGFGWLVLRTIPFAETPARLESAVVSCLVGISAWLFILFCLGNLGMLDSGSVISLCITGILLALVPRTRAEVGLHWRKIGLSGQSLAVITLAVLLPLLIKPLAPPLDWDELMYHLPYARLWAEQGVLVIDQWSRFPLMAYNMQLVYAAALSIGQDTLPHLLHALCGLAAAGLTFVAGRRIFDRNIAFIAVLIVLFATRREWSTANVDLAVMMFTSGAFLSLFLRRETGDQRWCYLGMIFIGMAVGCKYQALLYMPLVLVTLVCVERSPRVLFNSALFLLIFGGYWYFRNVLVAGNPIHPIGSELFGYWIWNAEDMSRLSYDLGRVRDWPHAALLIFPAAGLFWHKLDAPQRTLLLVAAGGWLIWWAVSGYPRYLMPIYPLLALLSAFVMVSTVRGVGLSDVFSRFPHQVQVNGVRLILLLAFLGCAMSTVKAWEEIHPPGERRTALLIDRFDGFALLNSVPDVPGGRLYQFGFEGELYYLGEDVIGDWFGLARYHDIIERAGNSVELHRHLQALGARKMLVNTDRAPFSETQWDDEFSDYFTLLAVSNKAKLFWVNDQ